MTTPALDDATRDHFYAEVYEHTTAPFLSPESPALEVKTFQQLATLSPRARVVDLGCGWGRHLAPLQKLWPAAIGVDRNPHFIAKALQTGASPVIRADVRALPFRTGSIDAVACFYSSIFFFNEAENLAALAEVARVLKAGGAFMLQTASPLYLRRAGPRVDTLQLRDGSEVYERVEFDPESGRENGFRRLRRATGESVEGHYSVRHYAPGELEVHGRRTGLKLDRLCGDLSLGAFTRQSQQMIVLMRRLPT